MNDSQNPPFVVSSKIYKSPRSNNGDEPPERIIKVTITLKDHNSNNNDITEKVYSKNDHDYSIKSSVKPILTISSSYVRESPPHNEKKVSTLKPKVKLVEQVSQFEEKVDQDDLEYPNHSIRQRTLGPPAFSPTHYKNTLSSNESIEKENYNSSSENLNSFSSRTKSTEQRKKNANIFSRTSRNSNQNSLSTPIKQEQNYKSQMQENYNSDQIKREVKIKPNFYHTQQINPKNSTRDSNQGQIQKQKRVIQNRNQVSQQFSDDYEEIKTVDETPKVPIIFRSQKTRKPSAKKKPYFSTSTVLFQQQEKVEKIERPKKFEKTERKINRKLLRIPTVNDDLPIFHEDPPEAINKNALIEEEEEKEAVSFVPLANDRNNNDNIRHKNDTSDFSLPTQKTVNFNNDDDFEDDEEGGNYGNINGVNLNEDIDENIMQNNLNEKKNYDNFNDSNDKNNFDKFDDDDDDLDEFDKDQNLNDFEQGILDQKQMIDNSISNKFTENKQFDNSAVVSNTINVDFNKPPQERRMFSKFENQVIFDENPDENFDANDDFKDQNAKQKPQFSIDWQSKLNFDNQISLDLGSEPLIPIKAPTNKVKNEKSANNQQPGNEKVINVTFDDTVPHENNNINHNNEISKESVDQTQTVINSPTKNEVSINFSPIKKRDDGEIIDENDQISTMLSKENEDKKDDNFWMFIPIDKKKRKKETNITQNMSKVVNVSRKYVKSGQNFRSLSMLLNQHRYEHFIMNLDNESQNLIGIYTLNDRMTQIKKIWGDGPEKATIDDVNSSLSYNPLSKKFTNYDPSFNQDVDAVCLK